MSLSKQLIEQIEAGIIILEKVTNPSVRAAPEKWSVKQILGHLIDSANNNHRRFIKAQYQDNLVFNGYQQEEWVIAQNYQGANWEVLMELWKHYNNHIAFVIAQIPESKLNHKTSDHNFHLMGWRTVKENEPSSLFFLIEDYILHMQHHLRQIDNLIKV